MDLGLRIVQVNDTKRGGWAHASCAVAQLKGGAGEGGEAEEEEGGALVGTPAVGGRAKRARTARTIYDE